MFKRTVSGIILVLLLVSRFSLAFAVQPVTTESTDRKVGVNVGDWGEYKEISFSWESNVSYDELDDQIRSFIRAYEDVLYWKITILEVSGTVVKFQWLWQFKNGTERISQTYWDGNLVNASFVDVATGGYTNMFLIASNLSAGEVVYTYYPDWIITETTKDTYLGVSREANVLSLRDQNGKYIFESIMAKWDKTTGISLEIHLQSDEYQKNNQTFKYNMKTKLTGTNRWGYRTWTVDDDGPADFHTIQEAINAADPGDTIYVYNGTYYERVVVNKTVSVIGENKAATIIDGDGSGHLVLVEGADNVTITGFTLRNASDGFYLIGFNHTIVGNIISNNTCHGIDMVGEKVYISENTITNNTYGIILGGSSSNVISGNTIINNQGSINLCEDCEDNDICQNTLIDNTMGIGIGGNQNTVIENRIEENWCGMEIDGTNNTIYHNNFINNTRQVYGVMSNNNWDDGYPSGGNYWSDYEERYPNASEIDNSGIWDTPHVIDENNQDNYPLMQPWGIVSGNLRILKPENGSTITGPVNITFAIENTGCNIEFEKGDSSNRIDLEIEYELNQTHGWGIQFWSTSDHGLKLSSGEEYAQEIVYDPSESEEDVPSIFTGEAPYGNTTIRLVHWKRIEERTFAYGEFGVTEIKVELQPVDTAPPTISVLSPENKTYTTTSILLIFTVDEPTSWIGYSLDDQPNVTITGNTTLTGLSGGSHNITVYANDTAGNMGASDTVHFTIAFTLAPDFTLTDIDGNEFSLSDYHGTVVLLDFFAIRCPPSVEEIPHLKSLYEQFGEDLVIISISSPEDEEVLRDFREEHGIEWMIANDTANVFGLYIVQYIPTLVIIDQSGYIRYTHAGLTEASVLSQEIEGLLPLRALLGTGWGWMRINAKESVYGRAELYEIGDEQMELVITYEGEEHVRRWNIIFHKEYKFGERYLCYSKEWGFLIVGLHKHRRWQFWHAIGRGVVAFGFPRLGRLRLMSI